LLKIQLVSAYNFGTSGNNPTKLYQATCYEAGVITCVQLLEGLSPEKLGRAKKSKIWHDFWQLSTLIANISGRDHSLTHCCT